MVEKGGFMRYETPEMNLIGPAAELIQGMKQIHDDNGVNSKLDNNDCSNKLEE
jgi:hypothetical protein